jgi:hypothetical protein
VGVASKWSGDNGSIYDMFFNSTDYLSPVLVDRLD